MSDKLKMSLLDIITNEDVLANLDGLISSLVAAHLRESVVLCQETINSTRASISRHGPRDYMLKDIEYSQKNIRALNRVHYYYTGRHISGLNVDKDEFYEDADNVF